LEARFDALDNLSPRELDDWIGDGGFIQRSLNDETREIYMNFPDYTSLSPKMDNAEKLGYNLVTDTWIFCEKYVIKASFIHKLNFNKPN
jgi:hypothetical protein